MVSADRVLNPSILFYSKCGTMKVLELENDFMLVALLWEGRFDTTVNPGLRRKLSGDWTTCEWCVTAAQAASQAEHHAGLGSSEGEREGPAQEIFLTFS